MKDDFFVSSASRLTATPGWCGFKKLRRLQGGLFDHLSDLAYDLGYADQAHFIKEFKEMSGQTPTTLVRSLRDWIPGHQRVAGRVESLTQPDGCAASFRG